MPAGVSGPGGTDESDDKSSHSKNTDESDDESSHSKTGPTSPAPRPSPHEDPLVAPRLARYPGELALKAGGSRFVVRGMVAMGLRGRMKEFPAWSPAAG